jgi:hypothetical protein
VRDVGLFTDFLNFNEANLGFEPSAPNRQPYSTRAPCRTRQDGCSQHLPEPNADCPIVNAGITIARRFFAIHVLIKIRIYEKMIKSSCYFPID